MIYQRGDRAAFVVLVCWAIAGCHRDGTSPDQTAQPPVEWYRAVVGKNLEAVPFFVGMPPPGAPGSCSIINGEEHIAVDCHWQDASTVELEFPVFATSIHATRQADGSLLGVWHPSRLVPATLAPTFAAARIPRPDPALRFPARFWAMPPVATGDFAGTWRFQFEELAAGKGTFRQTSDGVVTGTIIPEQIGDFRYMAGNARGSQLLLSTFDGQHAYVVRATLDPTKNGMRGTWTFAGINRDGLINREPGSVARHRAGREVRLKDGAKGVTIPQLDDPRYRGKPVIVDYFGTWCPACMDEMPFLLELYRRHHAEGSRSCRSRSRAPPTRPTINARSITSASATRSRGRSSSYPATTTSRSSCCRASSKGPAGTRSRSSSRETARSMPCTQASSGLPQATISRS